MWRALPRVAVGSRQRLHYVSAARPAPEPQPPAPAPAPAPVVAPPPGPPPLAAPATAPASGPLTPELAAALELVRKAFGPAAVPTGPTVRELWALYEKGDALNLRSWVRSAAAGRQILEAFGDRLATSISLLDVDAWRAKERERITMRGRPPMPATRNRMLIVFRRLLNWSVERGLLQFNPLARLRLEKERNIRETVLTDADVERIMAASDPMLRAIVLVLFDTGARRSEILGMRWDQLDVENSCIRLSVKQTKNGRHRIVQLTKRALDAILARPHVNGSPYVFACRTGRLHNYRWIYERYVRAVLASGVKGVNGETVTMHALRHAFIAKARKLHLPERTVMAQTGHLTRSAYDRYGGRVDADELASLISTMEAGTAVRP